jgi:hypothetical protein
MTLRDELGAKIARRRLLVRNLPERKEAAGRSEPAASA